MKRKQPKAPKTNKPDTSYRAFDVYLTNGDWLGEFTFANATQVRRLFKKCKIEGTSVHLA